MSFKKNLKNVACMCINVHLYVGASEGQNRALGPLELEFHGCEPSEC